ncbi:hypothetical protein C1O34_10395 [Staphylococcus schleiferi]|uniref:Uncharacterized protein n=1 Tax=Staphylococcus schleiferi TaxID=1295 RepID=A0ABX0FYF2_STASC|nr:hypothetical protein [Staphylococcus schleiferi]NHA41647.1 hypothetical protein [Staphylococcus schleiferi]
MALLIRLVAKEDKTIFQGLLVILTHIKNIIRMAQEQSQKAVMLLLHWLKQNPKVQLEVNQLRSHNA